jgi:hypothetical protein
MFLHRRFASLLLIFAVVVLPLQARVTRVEISSRVDVLNGKLPPLRHCLKAGHANSLNSLPELSELSTILL